MNVQLPELLQRLTVVAVTHHSAHCVADMARTLAPFPHVTVVDNASDDHTPALLRQQLPYATVLPLPENLGFGAANNHALDQVTTPFALLLNPDCHITPEAVAALIAAADAYPDAAIVAPQLWGDGQKPQLNYGWLRWHWGARGPGATGPLCVGHACAAAWLLRCGADRWRFDTDFFLYYEDEDLCARVLQARRSVLIEPAAQAIHANRGSVKGKSVLRSEWRRGYHHSRSKILFMSKHRSPEQARRTRWRGLWLGGLELVIRLLTLQPRLIARSAGRWAGTWSAPCPH